ncbi:leucine-rich repeat domain-containing protein [Hallella sp.]|uniref:leucine-rich repeat domain-containing protein n=1 Tax=Hallella sp. TaxID=2980186 RepID=UPI00307F0E78
MKETKKSILKVLKKDGKKKASKFDRMVLLLALQKIESDSFELDGEAIYTDDKHCLVYCLSQNESFVVPEGVEVIGEMAFRRKKNLKSVVLPAGLQKISRDAFYDCDQLDNVYIPASVMDINGYSFAECDGLRTVTFAAKPKHLSRHTFEDSDNLMRVVVPQGTSEAFKKALHYDSIDDEYLFVENKPKTEAEAPAKTAEKTPSKNKKEGKKDTKKSVKDDGQDKK